MEKIEKSKVYFTDMRTNNKGSLLLKLKRLIKAAGITNIPMEEQYVAIKLHFGEPGNLAFLRPNFAKAVVDVVKENGGRPFLTDCSTLYVGMRKNALDHMDAAMENGFSPLSCGCQIIIADGLKGTDDVEVPVVGGEYVKNAKIGRAIMDADVFISLSHFKGHEATGFGGALKNIGMGCGSTAGKMEQHCGGKPVVNPEICRGCNRCSKACAQDAIVYENKKAAILQDKCVGCGRCIGACNFQAISNPNDNSHAELSMRMAEYAKAVVDNRPCFHISVVMDVSPFCDCYNENDLPVVPDVGMFASFDPVALDKACVDAVNRQTPNAASLLGNKIACGEDAHDHFTTLAPTTDWRTTLEHAQKLGMGTMEYELVEVQ